MKKLSIFLTLVIAIVIGSSCTAQAPKANLKNEVDSLSYAIGLSQTQGLKQYLVMNMKVDTAYINDFIKGFIEGSNIDKTNKGKSAYLAGLQIGQQVGTGMVDGVNQEFKNLYNDSTVKVNKANLLAGFTAGIDGKGGKMTTEQAQQFAQTTMDNLRNAKMEKEFAGNKEAGIKFLEENKTKEGVVTLPSGLQYKIIKAGTGAIPAATDAVKVNYKGTLIDGTEFDSSYTRNAPAEFGVTQVIKGWTEALQLMPVGSKWQLFVPQELAYGSADRGTIKPFSTLIFDIELLDIVKKDMPKK
ncbi:MAG: FKBP-type peptidyl-prolyl cis-trans isomerase [Candidatus Azobacteroides sp.]|nr:FKBP-type peptidyl-prolyl cis-trans isomerase [Candidatus Azobacteroides sp.]